MSSNVLLQMMFIYYRDLLSLIYLIFCLRTFPLFPGLKKLLFLSYTVTDMCVLILGIIFHRGIVRSKNMSILGTCGT